MAGPRCADCRGDEWTDEGRCAACRAYPTLGYAVGELIEQACAIPDGEHVGEPYLLTPEMWRFLFAHYRVDPLVKQDQRGRWVRPFVNFRGSQLCRPQKWGKGPFSAAIVCAEAHPEAPVLFDGWDADGQPVGRPWATPHVQITAVSEDQVGNVFRALLPMIELGALKADIPDTGKTRINLPSGGLIEPVTASAVSRLGQRITLAIQDQTESWTAQNKGRALADNQRRGLAGMGGRWLETPNAWDPTEESVAQYTSEGTEVGVYLDDVEPGDGSIRNKAERRKMLKKVYGDSWWVDLDRIDGEIVSLLDRDPAQAERWFLNRKRATESAAFSETTIDARARADYMPDDGALIVIGGDGARSGDALGLVATEVETGFQWPLGVWEAPQNPGPDYQHPLIEVDGAMLEAFERYYVWRAYLDPQHIELYVEKWQGRWGKDRVLEWVTYRPRQIAFAVRNFTAAMPTDWSYNGDEVFVRHLKNARRQKVNVYDDGHRQMHTLSKDRHDSPRKIDAAMAAVLSWEARGDAIAAGATAKKQRSRVPVFG